MEKLDHRQLAETLKSPNGLGQSAVEWDSSDKELPRIALAERGIEHCGDRLYLSAQRGS
jgi:hypothetical protein